VNSKPVIIANARLFNCPQYPRLREVAHRRPSDQGRMAWWAGAQNEIDSASPALSLRNLIAQFAARSHNSWSHRVILHFMPQLPRYSDTEVRAC
jgi:hypothetical protein